jgi:hypothetical protein
MEEVNINSLNAELNPICHLLALLVAHHILHVSRIRVNKDIGSCGGTRIMKSKSYSGIARAVKKLDITVDIKPK